MKKELNVSAGLVSNARATGWAHTIRRERTRLMSLDGLWVLVSGCSFLQFSGRPAAVKVRRR